MKVRSLSSIIIGGLPFLPPPKKKKSKSCTIFHFGYELRYLEVDSGFYVFCTVYGLSINKNIQRLWSYDRMAL